MYYNEEFKESLSENISGSKNDSISVSVQELVEFMHRNLEEKKEEVE